MKKVIALILCLIIAVPICYVGFVLPKKVIGESDMFSTSEIKDAMRVAKKQVKSFDGVMKLLKIKYNEAKSEKVIASYGEKYDSENTIVIFIDFATNFKTKSLNPLDIYEDYNFILTRENKTSPWVVQDSGY